MAIMFGNGTVQNYSGKSAVIMKTEVFTAKQNNDGTGTEVDVPGDTVTVVTAGWDPYFTAPDGKRYKKENPKFYASNLSGTRTSAKEIASTEKLTVGEKYFCSYDLNVTGSIIDVSASSFPGTYYVTGDTYARSEASGRDEFYQFIIPKAKVTSENTITLEAEGDPSVFNLNLHVLRPADGVMMKLVKYDLAGAVDTATTGGVKNPYHNHDLVGNDETALPLA
jgi:hypothetical protein